MKVAFVYLIPLVWLVSGIAYVRSLPKDGFRGGAEIFFVLVIGVILLAGAGIFHMVYMRNVSSNEGTKQADDKKLKERKSD